MDGEDTLGKVMQLLRDGREQEAADAITVAGNSGMWRSANILSVVYEKFSDMEILYRCIIDTYTGDGYNFPKRVMIKAKKISHSISQGERLGDLPPGDLITVYRAANTPISKVRNDISWTTEKMLRSGLQTEDHTFLTEKLHCSTFIKGKSKGRKSLLLQMTAMNTK